MEERYAVVDILDFGAPVFVFMYFVDIEVFTSTSKKCIRGVQQGVGAEIDVIGNDI